MYGPRKTALKMETKQRVSEPTHEVINHKKLGRIDFQGTGQECANWMYLHKGIGLAVRPAISI